MIGYKVYDKVYDGDVPIMTFKVHQDLLVLQFVENDEWVPTVDDLNRVYEKLSEIFPGKEVLVFSDQVKIVRETREVE